MAMVTAPRPLLLSRARMLEVFSGVILLWRLHSRRDASDTEAAEGRAAHLVGLSPLLLALYVTGTREGLEAWRGEHH